MQHQQIREYQAEDKPARRRTRRSWGELLVILVASLWGALELRVGLPDRAIDSRVALLSMFVFTIEGGFCILAAIAAILRYRAIAGRLLIVASLTLAATVILTFFHCFEESNPPRYRPPDLSINSLIVSVFYLSVALLLFFLGRWLGSQEDIEESFL